MTLRPFRSLRGLCAAATAALLLTAGAAQAQAVYTPPKPADDSLYLAFGGEPGLTALTDDFVERLAADARTKRFFAETDLPQLKKQLAAQFCEVAGGPCRRDGPDMREAHEAMTIRQGDFNALVEILQTSMDRRGIAFTTQNRLLARLAPMHRDIVNAR